ncbi:MAG: glycosyltransferase family 4 protein [Candidatus Eisenbacteria bacterium]|uniref:Glycosyltransferase family 4 protein n=1 Tax=Eiseniibacteriota bacterium TaxID=2212470 RepID=A0A948W5B4_UNCEI|nr:glycosyltransferase family 4 protein [Candidatus Eisenbacteria bacterium]MBU1949770.1 glycosyltransferase family 4 protein [Candidatus Eisenbacteria bacterium]MBU2689411.1 glycosyltransferase family 4 protein [Candidatus Eisenbacteria bacterium]
MTEPRHLKILNVAHIRWWSALAHYAHAVAVSLQRRGHHVIAAGAQNSPYMDRCITSGLPTLKGIRSAGNGMTGRMPSLFLIRRMIREGELDVLIVHTGPGHGELALSRWGMKEKVLLIRARPEIRPPRDNMVNRVLHRRLTDRILLSGEFMKKDHYSGWFLDSGRMTVIHGGVDVEHFSRERWEGEAAEIRKRFGLSRRSTLVGLIGRLSPVKGHRTALEALLPLMTADENLQLIFAGGESQVRWIELAKKIPGALLARVHYIGQVPDAAPAMTACDAVLIPSTGSEAVCRVAMECLALGVPVVGTSVNVIPEVIQDGETGWIVPPGDPAALRRTVDAIMKNPDEARRRAERGHAAAQKLYSWDALGGRLEGLLWQALAGDDWD